MPKTLKDILNGVKASKIVPGSTGDEPGVDYDPKSKDEREFVKKHSTEKHEDRVGNKSDVYSATNVDHAQVKEKKHGYKNPEDKKVNEENKCNMTEEGTMCPVHEMSACPSTNKKMIKEVITKKTSAADIIKDFQKSKDPRFAGKSKAERTKMALGAYYSKHPEISKKVAESLAVPLIGSTDDDESAEMAKTELRALANKAMHLVMNIPDSMTIEPWVQSKIAKAKEMISSVHDYMIYGDHAKTEDEQTAPYDGGIDVSSGLVRNTVPNFAADVNTGRNV